RNHALKTLTWIDNQIPSDDQADLLMESLIENRAIKDIRLLNCFDQSNANGCRALAALMTSGRPFELLNFSANSLFDIDDVAAALATNLQLKELWINDNEINDRDAELIAQALKQNTNLHTLYLNHNRITPAGFEKIRSTIYDPSSLNTMESCNHTCYVDCVGGNVYNMTPRQRRNQKLYKLLSTRHLDGSNARHLNTELGEEKYTIKLVPKFPPFRAGVGHRSAHERRSTIFSSSPACTLQSLCPARSHGQWRGGRQAGTTRDGGPSTRSVRGVDVTHHSTFVDPLFCKPFELEVLAKILIVLRTHADEDSVPSAPGPFHPNGCTCARRVTHPAAKDGLVRVALSPSPRTTASSSARAHFISALADVRGPIEQVEADVCVGQLDVAVDPAARLEDAARHEAVARDAGDFLHGPPRLASDGVGPVEEHAEDDAAGEKYRSPGSAF
ncbi:hypothetical protein THAOC_25998, partial [Thalassiosira oceanica]